MGWAVEALAAIGIAIGLIGTVIPVLPGLVLVWASVVAWALLDGGGVLRWTVVGLATVLMVVGYLASAVVPGRRAHATSGWVLAAGAAGMVIGFFVIPVVGLVVGGLLGVFSAELVRTRDVSSALRMTGHTLRGFGLSVAVQLSAGLAIAVFWAGAVWVT